jgi:hypothetical protein
MPAKSRETPEKSMSLTFEWMELEQVTQQLRELSDQQRIAERDGKAVAAEVLSLDIIAAEQRREQLMAILHDVTDLAA